MRHYRQSIIDFKVYNAVYCELNMKNNNVGKTPSIFDVIFPHISSRFPDVYYVFDHRLQQGFPWHTSVLI